MDNSQFVDNPQYRAQPASAFVDNPSFSAGAEQFGTASSAPVAEMRAPEQSKNAFDHVQQWANNVADDLRYGTDRTGIGSLLRHMGAQGMESGTTSGVADFMGSIPLGALKMMKGASEYLNPQATPGEVWQGAKDVTGGGLQASTIPGAFVAPESGEMAENALSNAGDLAKNAASATGNAAKAAVRPFSLKAVQEALANAKEGIAEELQNSLTDIQQDWHQGVRDTLNAVAQEAGVQPQPAQSLNDVAANVSAAIRAKASGLYKQLDQAIGGTRFQTFDEQLSNVKRALRNSAGIDPDADGRLVERINQLEDAKAAALEQAKANGVDPGLIDQANSAHRQAMALEDLNKHLRTSMEGLRTDVGTAGTTAAREALNPTKLAPKLNRMYNAGRLQQALGESRADDVLEAAETAKQRAKDAAEAAVRQNEQAGAEAERKAANVKLRRYVAGTVLGGIPGFELLRHLLGE